MVITLFYVTAVIYIHTYNYTYLFVMVANTFKPKLASQLGSKGCQYERDMKFQWIRRFVQIEISVNPSLNH